jgi:hypothetical protein
MPHADHVAFHAEQPMKLYQESEVKVAMGHDESATLRAAEVAGLGPPTSIDVPHTGELVTARLVSQEHAFEISPPGDQPVRNIDQPELPATWTWIVKPIKPGSHYLHIEVSTLRQVEGHDSYTSLPLPNGDQPIHVVVQGVWPRLVYFNESTGPALKAFLALFPGGALLALGKWLWAKFRKRPPGGGASQPPVDAEVETG